ncbi:phosphomevalonate kinase [Erysipelothrix piscisicarius]|uniref:phosphomevalonate kinase n=1 Tax=Erysipelothrix piscisicarius TaxID=2485784 RepID=A0A3S8RLJ0_9FIRM|nr:phosphomevalonate kinase [Erysipelothrix piscisicarius]AZK43820.1 phosphomevalonate kinase [Erysipelothrix piscisicarius]
MIHVKFPGKLFFMGEYAIMEPGQKAVIAAIDRFLNVYIEAAEQFEVNSRYGQLQGTEIFMQNETLTHVKAAIEISRRYLKFRRITMTPFKMHIESELDSENEQKYGFGSSGVVLAAVIDAILRLHEVELESLELFKLSVMAQVIVGEISSGGDLASTCFGGTLVYQRYDESWLIVADMCNMNLVHSTWPGLLIEPLPSTNLNLCVGWTGTVNQTSPFVDAVRELKSSNPGYYASFLEEANLRVNQFIDAWKDHDFILVSQAIDHYRMLMAELGNRASINIETNVLTKLIESAHNIGLPAKISGSGGGDCGFALISENFNEKANTLVHEWEKHGILYLDVGVYKT